MPALQTIIGDYSTFLDTIIQKIGAAGFDFADFSQMDHMCYRAVSDENYQYKKQELQQVGTILAETMVNGRPIVTVRLHEPVRHSNWRIDAIELAAPKEGQPMREGLDHVELVLYDSFDTFLGKHPDKDFVLDSRDRGINPEIGFRLGDGLTVKFHLLSLTTVVFLEKKLGITVVKNPERTELHSTTH